MATSPNYGWSEPDNSSLVKNGAADIRTLGDSIDTSVWNIGFGQAGKNAIINGNFGIWQRGTSFNAATLFYTADRWQGYSYSGASQTVSQQSFTAGTAPVAGYESQFFLRATATNTGINIEQRIEDVRTYAGQPFRGFFSSYRDFRKSGNYNFLDSLHINWHCNFYFWKNNWHFKLPASQFCWGSYQ